jgi:hypothetical protein
VSWDQRFFDPIVLPGQKPLVTLHDAAQYITRLPKAEHDAEEWQAAMERVAASTKVEREAAPPLLAGLDRRRRRYDDKCPQ